LLGTDITPSDISSYCNTRADLLRAETRIYIGSILQLIVSASLFGFSLGGWNRHKYIKLKAKTIKLLLETQAKNSS
jgi:hypothetical protein